MMSLILSGAYIGSLSAVIAVRCSARRRRRGRPSALLLAVLAVLALIPVVDHWSACAPRSPRRRSCWRRVSGWHGLQRSWSLIRGRFWPTFGRILLLALISGDHLVGDRRHLRVARRGARPGNTFIYDQLASAIAAVFIGPITYIGVTLLYYDVRIRKEGFDIEMLARLAVRRLLVAVSSPLRS